MFVYLITTPLESLTKEHYTSDLLWNLSLKFRSCKFARHLLAFISKCARVRIRLSLRQ